MVALRITLFDETQTHNPESEIASSSADNNQPQSEATSEAVTASSTPAQETQGQGQPQKDMSEDFATALETFSTETESEVSDDRVIKGTVLKITPSHVVVDIGTKSEGVVASRGS